MYSTVQQFPVLTISSASKMATTSGNVAKRAFNTSMEQPILQLPGLFDDRLCGNVLKRGFNLSIEQPILRLPGLFDDRIYFYVQEGHFYREDVVKKCADNEFLELFNNTKKIDCQAKPGSLHNHPVPTFESVEMAAIRWACRLRVLKCFSKETVSQSIDFVVSAWPRKLSWTVGNITLMLIESLLMYQHMAKENHSFAQFFIDKYGSAEFDCFQQVISQPQPYWPVLATPQDSVHPVGKNSEKKLMQQWLSFKKDELNMANCVELLTISNGIPLIDKDELLCELLNIDYHYVLVLNISPLDELTQKIELVMNKENVEEEKLVNPEDLLVPWYMINTQKDHVLEEIKKLAVHIAKQNSNIKDKVFYSIMFADQSHQHLCWYSVHEHGVVEKDYITELPSPPTNLTISLKTDDNSGSFICLEWSHKDLGYPGEFLIQYRLKGTSNLWERKKIKETHTSISYNIGTRMEFRVATSSCIGRSDFSDIVNTDSLFSSDDWQVQEEENFQTITRKRRAESIESDESTPPVSPAKKIIFQQPIESTDQRFAQSLVKKCSKIGSCNRIEHYLVPLTNLTGNETVERFAFGETNQLKERKTILLMGMTGSRKIDLINAMINFIFNVELTDGFRFQLIAEQLAGQSSSTIRRNRIYEINYHDGFRIPYSLVIIDTSGFNKKFFEEYPNIYELDMIGIVVKPCLSHLTSLQLEGFNSLLSIFGNDVKENIQFMLTFCDVPNPTTLNAIASTGLPFPKDAETGEPLHCKFNSYGFFRHFIRDSKGDCIGWKNFVDFFSTLSSMKTKSLSLSREVVEERSKLELAENEVDSMDENNSEMIQRECIARCVQRLKDIALHPIPHYSRRCTI